MHASQNLICKDYITDDTNESINEKTIKTEKYQSWLMTQKQERMKRNNTEISGQ